MAKNNDKNTDQFEQIGETISKTEQFIEQNKKRLSIITSVNWISCNSISL